MRKIRKISIRWNTNGRSFQIITSAIKLPMSSAAERGAYNLCQIGIHTWGLNEVAQSGFFTQFNYLWQAVDYSQDPSALRLMRSVYVFYLLKYLDMFDTLFFILRKKWDQITFLHVVHHGLVPLICYPISRFVGGGNSVIGGSLNSMEHILMYFYYLVAAMGPRFQPFVIKWKKSVTIFQIAQFFIVSLHSFRLFFVNCPYPIFFYLLAHKHWSPFPLPFY